MKTYSRLLSYILVTSFLSACAPDPYDTSTPEKFVESMGQAGLTFEQHYPIPFIYEKTCAKSIQNYDEAGAKAKESFEKLKSIAIANFPSQVNNRFGKLNFESFKEGAQTSNISFSISNIGDQIASRTPSDYEFISSSEDGGITTITMKIEGNEVTIPTKNYDGQLRMFMEEENVERFNKLAKFANDANELFTTWTAQIESEEVTEQNILERAVSWQSDYSKLLSELNG